MVGTLATRPTRPPTRVPDPPSRTGRAPTRTRWWTPWLFLLPGVILFAVFFVWPAVRAVELAFYEYDGIGVPTPVGLDNFERLLHDPRFHMALKNSFIFLLGMIPLGVIIPLLLAVAVNQRLRGIQVFRLAIVMPVIVSMVAVAVTWKYLLDPEGVLSWFVVTLGLSDEPVAWLLNSDWALPAMILIEGWKSMGLYMMIYLAGLQSVPSELYEAADLDGASAWRKLRSITWPLMLPYVAVVSTMVMLDAMQVFASIFVMTRGGPRDHTLTLGYYIWSKAFEDYEFGYAGAIALVLWAIMIVIALLNYRLTRSRS